MACPRAIIRVEFSLRVDCTDFSLPGFVSFRIGFETLLLGYVNFPCMPGTPSNLENLAMRQNAALPPLSKAQRRPNPYPAKLTPSASLLRPHCFARDRLRQWIRLKSRLHNSPDSGASRQVRLSKEDRERITDVIMHAWDRDTREAYGSGLLVFHVFCDEKQISEADRAPASQLLLSAFVSNLAASYSGKTISNYFYGVRAWHVLHGTPWRLESAEMETMLRAAEKLTPPSSKRKPRRLFTPDYIIALRGQLDLNKPLDAAVYACLTTCFYASARVGELTVQKLDDFNSTKSVTRRHLSYGQDRLGTDKA